MSLSNAIGAVFRWLGGAVVPMILSPTAPAAVAWFVHVVLVSLTTIGLYFAQPRLGLTVQLGYGPSWFHPFWLPALFLLIYALVWSAAWLARLLAPNQIASTFPDIDQAWDDICNSLAKAGIGLGDTPMYLVLGEWNCGYEPVFRMLPGGLAVNGGTAASSPLQAFANRDGIYIAVPGACLLGFRGQLTEYAESDPAAAAGSMFQSIGAAGKSISIGGSIAASIAGSIGGGGGGPLQEIQRIIKTARDQHRPLTEAEKLRVRELSDSDGGAKANVPLKPMKGGPTGTTVLQNPQIANELAARLVHVCGLLASTRWPLCPINGAIVAVPMNATNTDVGAQQWGLVAREDLLIADYALKMRFPVFMLVGGAEDLPGGRAFFQKFAQDKGNQRLGKSFPLNPDLTVEGRAPAVETVARWIFGGLIPYWALRQMRADTIDDSKHNGQLVRFMHDIRTRSESMARLLSRALATEVDRPPLFAGVYLNVVLPDAPGEAKFVRDFFVKVEQSQGFVQWTDDAYAEDSAYRTRAKLGMMAAFTILGATIAFAVYVVMNKWK